MSTLHPAAATHDGDNNGDGGDAHRRQSLILSIELRGSNARRHQLSSRCHGSGGTERGDAGRRSGDTHGGETSLSGVAHAGVRVDRRGGGQSRHRRRQSRSRRRHRRKTQISQPRTKDHVTHSITSPSLTQQHIHRVSTNVTRQISRRFQEGFLKKSSTSLRCFGLLCNVPNLLVCLNI